MIGVALSRPEVRFDLVQLRKFFADKRVLITGAAGSIGSALAQQLAQLGCAHLAMLDQFDHGLIDIVESVKRAAPRLPMSEVLCDVRDAQRVDAWMRRVAPDVVIHSAALKHVHLGERHPAECVLTNLVGVRNVLAAAARAGVGHFILVSSDKAAAPTCLMGATKRLAELHLAGFAAETEAPIVLRSVRFGNVLGTQGSVLPRWRDQIAAGGPLEVTHAEMERYFMSADEAVGLILSVAAMQGGESAGRAYCMEMGQAVSILDMGRRLIARSGKHIDIVFTGLRPGEKIKEQLFDEYEQAAPAPLPHVFGVSPLTAEAYVSSADIDYLENIARTMEDAVILQRVFAQLDSRLAREERAVG